MPGVLCNGVDTDQPYINRSRAYCQGFSYRLGGTGAGRPITDNPYDATGRPVEKGDWDKGWTACNGEAGNTLTRANTGCCEGEGQTVQA